MWLITEIGYMKYRYTGAQNWMESRRCQLSGYWFPLATNRKHGIALFIISIRAFRFRMDE